MNKFEPDNTDIANNRDHTLDDDRVEVVDLGLPTRTSRIERLVMRTARFAHTHSAMRDKLISALALLSVLLIVLPVASSTALIHKRYSIIITVKAGRPPFNTFQDSFINISAASNVAYISSQDGLITAYHADNGYVLWHHQLPSPSPYRYLLATNTTLYTISRYGNGGIIEALRSTDGMLLWQRPTPAPGIQPLQIDGGILYINTADGPVLALNGNNGALLWQFASHERVPSDSKLYAAEGVAAIVSDMGTVDVLHATTGKLLYSYPYVNGAWKPTVENNIIYIASGEGWLEARRTSDGSLIWRTPSNNTNFWSPTVTGGLVFVDNGHSMMNVLRSTDGHLLWQYNISEGVAQQPVLQDHTVFLTTLAGSVVALHASDGSQLWQFQPPQRYQFFWFLPMVAGNILYINSENGNNTVRLYALDVATGHTLWTRPVSLPDVRYDPIVVGGIIYFAQSNGAIDALRSSDGGFVWFYTPSAPILWYPQLVNGLLYIQQLDGTMNVVQVNDGSILWHYSANLAA